MQMDEKTKTTLLVIGGALIVGTTVLANLSVVWKNTREESSDQPETSAAVLEETEAPTEETPEETQATTEEIPVIETPADEDNPGNITINFVTDLPQEFSYIFASYTGHIFSKAYITHVSYTFEYNPKDDDYRAYFYFDGMKSYDEDGQNNRKEVKISLNVLNGVGTIVDRNVLILKNYYVGDIFLNEKCTLYGLKAGGTYNVGLSDFLL